MLKRILLVLLAFLLIIGCCSCNSGNSNETESQSDTDNIPEDAVVLSGETRFRIVYAKDADPAPAKKIYNRLKALDKNAIADDYYVLTTDETPEDSTPEILVGLTNRADSTNAKSDLKTYLDYSINVSNNKIIIYANTNERLSDATKDFASQLKKTDSGMIYYQPASLLYYSLYTDYKFPSFKLGNTDIKNFSIVTSANASENEKSVASDLQLWIAENTGAMLSIKTDNESATANEIIVGATTRPECSAFTETFAKDVYYSTSLNGTKLVIYAGTYGSIHAAANAFKEKATELNGNVSEMDVSSVPSLIKNKKAIFIGNSFIYWGGCVTFIKNDGIYESVRAAGGDKGYFNEICKANGIEMDVYNYTYGAQNLNWIYENKLKDKDKAFLEDIDYVFISEAGENNSGIATTVQNISALFPNAEEIVYLAHENNFSSNHTSIINALPKFAEQGIKIVAWGDLVRDIYTGEVAVPGATLQYNKNSFVKNSTGFMSEEAIVTRTNNEGDSFHQNPLAGYITAQMCFSAITGSLCEGQKYEFCWDKTIAPQYDLQNFVEHQYNNGQTTNFVEIFNSPADMLGIQKLMDEYMIKYN